AGKIKIAGSDFIGTRVDFIHAVSHCADGPLKIGLSAPQVVIKHMNFIAAVLRHCGEAAGEITAAPHLQAPHDVTHGAARTRSYPARQQGNAMCADQYRAYLDEDVPNAGRHEVVFLSRHVEYPIPMFGGSAVKLMGFSPFRGELAKRASSLIVAVD